MGEFSHSGFCFVGWASAALLVLVVVLAVPMQQLVPLLAVVVLLLLLCTATGARRVSRVDTEGAGDAAAPAGVGGF